MAEIIQMPKLGFDMKEGTLVRWVKMEGDSVKKGDVLAEIETDKATVEVESSHDGVVLHQLVSADAIVPIGDPIAVIGEKGEQFDLNSLKLSSPGKNSKDSTRSKEGEEKQVVIEEPIENSSNNENNEDERIKASPLARKIASENNIMLDEINGSGPGGRIVKKDVEKEITKMGASKSSSTPAALIATETKAKSPTGVALPISAWQSSNKKLQDRTIPLSKLRQAIGRRMAESKQQIPHFYATYSYDVESLMNLRSQANLTLPDDQKLSVNDFIVKAVAVTLKQFPNLNASLQEKDVIQHASVNIGVAVAVEGGLLTVVVKDADLKPLRMISSEVKEMAGRVKTGKVRADDVDGSTFSISNLGMFGVEEFSAIINPPEAAILAVSAAKKVPVVKNDEIVIGWKMEATISVDHRISDGAEAAQFLNALAFQLENPIRLLL